MNLLLKWSAWLAMLTCQNVLMSGDSTNLADIDIWLALPGTHFGAVWQWEILFSVLAGQQRQQLLLLACLLQPLNPVLHLIARHSGGRMTPAAAVDERGAPD